MSKTLIINNPYTGKTTEHKIPQTAEELREFLNQPLVPKKKKKIVIKKKKPEIEEVQEAMESCMDQVDNIFYNENIDWSFDIPDDRIFETIYIFKRKDYDDEDTGMTCFRKE